MQIAACSDKERRKKFGKENGASQVSPNENGAKEAFHLPDPYLLNKFVDEFLKSDGVQFFKLFFGIFYRKLDFLQ